MDWYALTYSSSTSLGKDNHRCFEEDHNVTPQAKRCDIGLVEGDTLSIGHIIASADLPKAGDTRANGEIIRSSMPIVTKLALGHGPRAYKAHIAIKDIYQLG